MLRRVAGQRVPITQIRHRNTTARKPKLPQFIQDARNLISDDPVATSKLKNEVKEIVDSSKSVYYDPGNRTLDLSLSNNELYKKIFGDSRMRTTKRVEEPSQEWIANHKSQIQQIYSKMMQHLTSGRVSLEDNLSPISVGDLVLLSEHSTLLHIVVACPKSLDSDKYTFIDNEGEITYGSKHLIKLRIPQIIPKKFLDSLELICLEKKHLGVAPIGMPDSKFSRSPEALPKQLQKSSKGDLKPTSGAELSTSGDDFIVAQATSQLLTDTDVKTYIVPVSARRVFSDFLTSALIATFSKVTAFMNKLDYFHKVLQYDENNNIIEASRTIPLFELFDFVSNFNQTLLEVKKVKGDEDEFRIINSFVRGGSLHDKTTFGKKIPHSTKKNYANSSHSYSSYVAFIVALSRCSRKWKLNLQRSTKTPISVEILPTQKSLYIDEVQEYLKEGGSEEFVNFYLGFVKSGELTAKPSHYGEVIQLFKDFIASNIVHDRAMESVLGSLIRNIDGELEKAGLHQKQSIPYSYEYSRSRALEIVTSLESSGYTNPMSWSDDLKLPHTGVSPESDVFLNFYSYLDSKFKTKPELTSAVERASESNVDISADAADKSSSDLWLTNEFFAKDPLADLREDFGDIPVYCIDSATAHEIDDGISIHTNNDNYVITVHVANPTSYIKQRSAISEIAFRKGTTVYLPEGATMMLPLIISKMCGLNGEESTRTFAIQFDINRSVFDHYLKDVNDETMPKSSLAKKVLKLIDLTARVKFFTAHNFPKNFTYEKVNKVLNDELNNAKFQNGELSEGSDELNLFRLYHLSSILRHIRVSLGSGLDFGSDVSKVAVEYQLTEPAELEQFQRVKGGYSLTLPKGQHERTPKITITEEIDQNNASKSQKLVSNLMIAANYAGLVYAHKNKIPIIHRTQEMSLEKSVKNEMQSLSRSLYEGGKPATVVQKLQILSILTAANYEVTRKRHESLGLDSYLNFTSPLRRYVDMVNHWIFEEHARKIAEIPTSKEDVISKSDADYIASHLQSCDLANKSAQRFSERFWKGTFLKHYFEKLYRNEISDPIEFSILLKSDAKFGNIRAEVLGFADLKCTILQNDYVVNKFATGEFKVGQVLANAQFHVEKLDFLDDEFVIQLG